MHVDGRCHCGRITYEAEIDPAQVMICHCTDCQMLTGSAYRVNVRAPAASFRMLSGEPRIYVKTAESGNKRLHAFCPDCGTPVYSAAPVVRGCELGGVRLLRDRRHAPCARVIVGEPRALGASPSRCSAGGREFYGHWRARLLSVRSAAK